VLGLPSVHTGPMGRELRSTSCLTIWWEGGTNNRPKSRLLAVYTAFLLPALALKALARPAVGVAKLVFSLARSCMFMVIAPRRPSLYIGPWLPLGDSRLQYGIIRLPAASDSRPFLLAFQLEAKRTMHSLPLLLQRHTTATLESNRRAKKHFVSSVPDKTPCCTDA